MTSPDPHATDFLAVAAAAVAATAVDAVRVLDLPGLLPDHARAALDGTHDLLIALHRLLDAHTSPGSAATAVTPGALPHLAAARDYLWHSADQVHLAYHHAPHPGDRPPAARSDTTTSGPDVTACRRGLPEGAPEFAICQRHQQATVRVRRHTTPADLARRRITGTVSHSPTGPEGTAV